MMGCIPSHGNGRDHETEECSNRALQDSFRVDPWSSGICEKHREGTGEAEGEPVVASTDPGQYLIGIGDYDECS